MSHDLVSIIYFYLFIFIFRFVFSESEHAFFVPFGAARLVKLAAGWKVDNWIPMRGLFTFTR